LCSSPAYNGLTNNISIFLQELKGHPWKEGTGDFVNVRVVGDYLHGFSKAFDIESLIKFNTRVEKLEKIGNKWQLQSSTLIKNGPERGKKTREIEVSFRGSRSSQCYLTQTRALTPWLLRPATIMPAGFLIFRDLKNGKQRGQIECNIRKDTETQNLSVTKYPSPHSSTTKINSNYRMSY
jgi:hypothetical protein